jgi:hypothetical protein
MWYGHVTFRKQTTKVDAVDALAVMIVSVYVSGFNKKCDVKKSSWEHEIQGS